MCSWFPRYPKHNANPEHVIHYFINYLEYISPLSPHSPWLRSQLLFRAATDSAHTYGLCRPITWKADSGSVGKGGEPAFLTTPQWCSLCVGSYEHPDPRNPGGSGLFPHSSLPPKDERPFASLRNPPGNSPLFSPSRCRLPLPREVTINDISAFGEGVGGYLALGSSLSFE